MLGSHFSLFRYLQILTQVASQSPLKLVESLADALYYTWSQDRTVFLCGEGTCATSATLIAQHMIQNLRDYDLSTRHPHERIRVILLPDDLPKSADGTNGAEEQFLKPLVKSARPDDLLIAMSVRHPSPHVLKCVEWANSAGLVTWALTGHHGVRLRKKAQYHLGVPLTDIGLVEVIQLLLMHWVLDDVCARMFRLGRYTPPEVAVIEN